MDAAARPIDPEELLRHAGRLRALARRLVDEHEADDVVQETLAAAVERPPREEVPLAPWLSRVARNFSLKSLRSRGRRERREGALPAAGAAASPEESVARTEMLRELVDAVLALEPIYRDVVVARFFDELEMPEVARRLGVPLETARTRLKRALATLRDRLDRKYGDRRAWALLLVGGERGKPRTAVRVGAAAAVGGLLMGKKLLVAAAALLLAAAWFALREDASQSAATTSVETAAAPKPEAAPRARGKAETPAAPEPAAPPDEEIKGPRVTGRVVDEAGSPVVGATVISLPDDIRKVLAPENAGAEPRTFRAKTGPDGRFVLGVDEAAPVLTLFAEAAGRAPDCVLEVRPGADVEIRLAAAAAMSGNVLDMDGEPVVGAKVEVVDLLDAVEVVRAGSSGSTGAYRVVGLPQSGPRSRLVHRTIEVTAQGFAPLFLFQRGRTSDGDFVLTRGAALKGVVQDAGTGAPITGARVVLWSNEGQMGFNRAGGVSLMAPRSPRTLAETRTGPDGAYAFERLPSAGFHHAAEPGRSGSRAMGLAAWKEGWCAAAVELPLPKDGEVVERPLKLWAAAVVEGAAVTADGRPVAGVNVHAKVAGRDERFYVPPRLYADVPTPWASQTDEQGRFRIAGVPASGGAPVQATVTARHYVGVDKSPEASITIDVAAGAVVRDVKLVVEPVVVPSVAFVVVDSAGAPVAGATVRSLEGWIDGTVGRTGLDGKLVLQLVNRGVQRDLTKPMAFSVKARGFAVAWTEAPLTAEQTPEVRVTLVPGRSVSGRVERADGAPAADVHLSVTDARWTPPPNFGPHSSSTQPLEHAKADYGWAQTGADGTFLAVDLPEGPYRVTAGSYVLGSRSAPPAAVATNVASDASDVLLVLPVNREAAPSQPLDVVVTDAVTGRPIVRFAATLDAGGPMPLYAQPRLPGRARFASVPPGTWTVHIETSEYAAADIAGVAVAADAAPPPVETALSRGATVRGRISVLSGEALEDADVSFRPDPSVDDAARGRGAVSARLAGDGTFVARGLSAGRYQVVVSSQAGGRRSCYFPADGRSFEAPGEGDATYEAGVALGACATVSFDDPRLPARATYPPQGTEEQLKFGAALVVEIHDAAGKLLFRHKGTNAANCSAYVPAGEMVATLSPLGETPRVERFVAQPGATSRLKFKSP